MEQVIGLTGIGGQGIQLAAKSLAEAAIADGRRVQMFASYGGMMRGGNSDSYVVLSDHAVVSPPVPSQVEFAVVMHHAHATDLWNKLTPDGLAVVNSSIVDAAHRPTHSATLLEIDALHRADEVGAPLAASLVAIGALAAHTALVSSEALLRTAARVLPDYRTDAVAANQRALEAGLASTTRPTNSVLS